MHSASFRVAVCRVHNRLLRLVDRRLGWPARRCPCCGWTGFRFRSYAVPEYFRANAVCPSCRAFERHRALASFYPAFFRRARRPARLIHVAAEPCLRAVMLRLCDRYETSSFDPAGKADLHLDLTNLSLPDECCDAIVVNHVLDCMPDDRSAAIEMYRVLRPGGVVLAAVAFEGHLPGRALKPVLSTGQHRVYGADFVERFVPFTATVMNAGADLSADARRVASIPKVVSVLALRK